MTRTVKVYGFGSAFSNTDGADDVDLLIVHPNSDAASCQFAIQCKQQLAERIDRVHVTMLSAREVAHFQFMETAEAIYLGIIREDQLDEDAAAVCNILALAVSQM